MTPNFTIVCGVDRKHLQQLSWTWPTWKRHKPSLLQHDMVVFCDREQVRPHEVRSVVDHPRLLALSWPPIDIDWGMGTDKWDNPQRYKMLSGFVHVPPAMVQTPYWLKLDTDVVATGKDDWINPSWFVGDPAIISHKWSFTKPADQMLRLDQWVYKHHDSLPVEFKDHLPLGLVPKPGASRLGHKRIISRVAFFDTGFTNYCARLASSTCGLYQLPCKSQDGFMWYVAKRLELGIKRVDLKDRVGFSHWSTDFNIRREAEKALEALDG